jgi:GAF domain-containing protein
LSLPITLTDQTSLDIVRSVHDWAVDSVQDADLSDFFQRFAPTLCGIFGAKMVAIWDNNHRNNCLVLQASAPERDDIIVSHAIATESSSTGAAVEKSGIVFFPDILNPGGKRHFAHPSIVEKLRLKSMLSIPVFSPILDHRVGVVINLCFDEHIRTVNSFPEEDIKRLASYVGIYIQYLVYRRNAKIIDHVRSVAGTSKGILPLFDRIQESFRDLTHCADAAIFRWDKDRNDLYQEAPADIMFDVKGNPTRWLSDSRDFNERFDSQLANVCVVEKQTLVVRIDAPVEDADWQPINVQCPYLAVPIRSSTNEVLGVIRCRKPVIIDSKSPSFSSFDVIALESFAGAIAPSVERFLHLREGTGLMAIVGDVSKALSEAYELDTSLQNMIETLVEAMHSKAGSIYLRKEGTDSFVIRAATEPRKRLISEEAEYKVGEGVTGNIASGKLLNFRTQEELRSYPGRKGKYHAAVWGIDSIADSDTLLGVPIVAGDKVIGVWKIENVYRTETHPDPYYTDEDVQAAQVISYFLKYVIQNYRQEQTRLGQLMQLPVTSDRIQRAPNEDAAIRVVMNAVEDAGFEGAVLSVYDNDTKLISEKEFSGSTWTKQDARDCHINDYDIRAHALKKGQAELVENSLKDPRCTNNPAGRGLLKAQYVLPLRLEDELLGTLQVDIGGHGPDDPELLPLRAFASHLSVAISRRRSIQKALALTEQIMQSSRFITAEALSGMTVHSLKHSLGEINRQLKEDLSRKEIKETKFLFKTLGRWERKLQDLETDLKNALLFVRAPVDESEPLLADLHEEIKSAISTWLNYITSNDCKVAMALNAKESKGMLPPSAFREIMAILFINAVQAHARHIQVTTYNRYNIRTASNTTIREAFCVDCEDDGDGLPTTNYEILFDSKYTTRPMNSGTGLGLYVARLLARRGHGDLEVVERTHSRSTAFRLSLPLERERRQPRDLSP